MHSLFLLDRSRCRGSWQPLWQPVQKVELLAAKIKGAVSEYPVIAELQTGWDPPIQLDLAKTAWSVQSACSASRKRVLEPEAPPANNQSDHERQRKAAATMPGAVGVTGNPQDSERNAAGRKLNSALASGVHSAVHSAVHSTVHCALHSAMHWHFFTLYSFL